MVDGSWVSVLNMADAEQVPLSAIVVEIIRIPGITFKSTYPL